MTYRITEDEKVCPQNNNIEGGELLYEEEEASQPLEIDIEEISNMLHPNDEESASNNPIYMSFQAFLGRGIDKTFFIKCINMAEESNLAYELLGLPTFPRNEDRHLLATHDFWIEIYHIIKSQNTIFEEETQQKIGFNR